VKINGVRHYLWRAVDQDGTVLDILVQSKRDAKAAKRFMAKLMKKQCREAYSEPSADLVSVIAGRRIGPLGVVCGV
jgi:transposase-like protein